jgi:hypothetical protein
MRDRYGVFSPCCWVAIGKRVFFSSGLNLGGQLSVCRNGGLWMMADLGILLSIRRGPFQGAGTGRGGKYEF